mgnify:CR=1 FL=1
MANRRPGLKPGKMREVKHNLVKAITDHQRNVGMLPNVKATEDFVSPIVGRLEHEHEEDRTRDMTRPEKTIGPAEQSALKDPDVRLIRRAGPSFVLDKATGEATQVAGPPVVRRLYPAGTTLGDDDIPAEVFHERLLFLKTLPAWDALVLKIWLAPHEGMCTPSKPCGIGISELCMQHKAQKAGAVLELVRRSFAVFGDPRKPLEPKLIVTG